MTIEFYSEFDPQYAVTVWAAPGIRRVLARNPDKYTAWGTGTYIVGGDGAGAEVAIIDPGPALGEHIEAILTAVRGQRVTHVLITHTHADHSPAAAAIVEATGATTYGHGPHPPGADTDGEEHGDRDFVPEVAVGDGDVIHGGGEGADAFRFECLHTPGHISNHVCYAERRRGVLFSGDHVMGWSTTVVSPPDGDITAYMANLERLLDRDETVYFPTHGPPITDPRTHVRALLEHRRGREHQIVAEISRAPRRVEEIVEVVYAAVDPELHAPAARSVLAHLIALERQGRARRTEDDRWALN